MTFRLIPGEDIAASALTLHALRAIANQPRGVVASFWDAEGDECVVCCAHELEEARLIAALLASTTEEVDACSFSQPEGPNSTAPSAQLLPQCGSSSQGPAHLLQA